MHPDPHDTFLPLARSIFPADASPPSGITVERIHALLARLLEAAAAGEGAIAEASLCLSPTEQTSLAALPHLFARINGRLMLPRYAHQLHEMRSFFEARLRQGSLGFDDTKVATHLNGLLPEKRDVDPLTGKTLFDNLHQRLAIAALVDARVGVLTGGPGTGKTTTAAALLALRHRVDPVTLTADTVLVTAPSGKAACRIKEAIKNSAGHLQGLKTEERHFLQSIRCMTLHRALEWGPEPPEKGGPFRRHALRKLEVRMVLVDEASMVDLSLMHALLQAMPEDASLLLLGDNDQLKSVEVGGILAELVARSGSGTTPPPHTASTWSKRLNLLEETVQAAFQEGLPSVDPGSLPRLPGLTVGLKYSRRAMNAPWILQLADLTRPGTPSTLAEIQTLFAAEKTKGNHALEWVESPAAKDCLSYCHGPWMALAEASSAWTRLVRESPNPFDSDTALNALDALGKFQLLCSTNAQVEEANAAGKKTFYGGRSAPNSPLPHGCPLLITVNDRSLGLSNGDIGIALAATVKHPAIVALFAGSDGHPRLIPLAQLPPHQAAFGLTVHKSQGSEWRHIAIRLPEDGDSQILTRNLLYTAITRSSEKIALFGALRTLQNVLES